MKPIVLFVDDEPNIVSGLRRATRALRDKCEIHFANSGQQALQLISEMKINTVVTDMRMPEMDGAELLSFISKQWPGINRMVLSGEADEKSAVQIIGRSHRFLSKPCDYNALCEAVRQPFDFGNEYVDRAFSQNVSHFDRLLATPGSMYRLRGQLQKAVPNVADICATIMSDPSLSARILQIVNSAYFGRPLVTSNIATAVKALGIDRIRKILDEERIGSEALAVSKTGHVWPRIALAAKEQSAKQGGGSDVQAVAYATALFSNLGHVDVAKTNPVDDIQDTHLSGIQVYLAALFGFPQQLIASMAHFQTLRREDIDSHEISELAVISAFASQSIPQTTIGVEQ